MPWVRLDENFADHPKVERVGPLAAWLHVVAVCYCARHLTDGHIPKAKAVRLVDIPDPTGQIQALVSEGMWVENGTDYVIHDYLDYQPSRASVLSTRAKDRERKARSGKDSGQESARKQNVRPVPSRSTSLLTSSSDSRANGERPDDDELSTGDVPQETWTAYADLKLKSQGNVKNPGPWKASTAANACNELGAQAARWWAEFDLTPRRLAECLIDGQIRNVPRRKEPT